MFFLFQLFCNTAARTSCWTPWLPLSGGLPSKASSFHTASPGSEIHPRWAPRTPLQKRHTDYISCDTPASFAFIIFLHSHILTYSLLLYVLQQGHCSFFCLLQGKDGSVEEEQVALVLGLNDFVDMVISVKKVSLLLTM